MSILNKMRRAVKTCWWERWAIELGLAEEEYREYCEARDEGRRLDWLRAWERGNRDRVTSEGHPISFTPDSDQEEFHTMQVLRKAAPVQEPVSVDPEDRQDHDAWLAGALARGYEEAGLVATTDEISVGNGTRNSTRTLRKPKRMQRDSNSLNKEMLQARKLAGLALSNPHRISEGLERGALSMLALIFLDLILVRVWVQDLAAILEETSEDSDGEKTRENSGVPCCCRP